MRNLLLLLLVVILASCAGGTGEAAGPDPGSVYFIGESAGGCAQMGPNCLRVVVFGNGSVEAYRVGGDEQTPADTESIDGDLVDVLHREIVTTDMHQLIGTLPPGECRGCYDGIDTIMRFYSPPLDVEHPAFSSVDVELDRSEPLLAAAWAVYEAALEVVEIPLVAR